MNNRERVLAIVVAALVGGYALLTWVIDPVMAAFDGVDKQSAQLQSELDAARAMVDSEATIVKRWTGYKQAGLNRSEADADGEMTKLLLNWAEQSGIKVGDRALNPRSTRVDDDDERFVRVQRTFNATGSIRALTEFLWSVRQSPIPLRVEKCNIDKPRDKGEDLQLTLSVSTLILAPDKKGGKR